MLEPSGKMDGSGASPTATSNVRAAIVKVLPGTGATLLRPSSVVPSRANLFVLGGHVLFRTAVQHPDIAGTGAPCRPRRVHRGRTSADDDRVAGEIYVFTQVDALQEKRR